MNPSESHAPTSRVAPIQLPEDYLLGVNPGTKLAGGLGLAATGVGFAADAIGAVTDLAGTELYMAWVRALAGPLVVVGLGVLAVAMGVQELRLRARRQRTLERVEREWDELVAGAEVAMTTGEGVAAYLEAEGLGEPWLREPLLERLAAADRKLQGLGDSDWSSSAQ